MPRERARRFLSRQEAEQARPKLDPGAQIPLDEFEDLIGDYKFKRSDWVRCQLVDARGKCRKKHGWGWIAQLKNEIEGYIGHDCVEDHFGKDPRFAALFAEASARALREIDTDILVARLDRLLKDPTLPASIERAKYRQRHLSARITNVRRLLPLNLLRKLDSVKGNNCAVPIWVFYIEEEEDPLTKKKRKVTRRQEYDQGPLNGLDGLEEQPVLKIGGKLAEAEAALVSAIASIDQPDADMKKWAARLEYVDLADQQLSQRESLISNFCRPENLKLLWLFERHTVDRIAIASAVLELVDSRQATEQEAAAAVAAWSAEIRRAYGDRDFEVNS